MNTRRYLEAGVALTPEQRQQAGFLFVEHREQIECTVEALCNKYGMDAEEMLSESTAIFMAAFAVYDDSIPFSAWLHYWVKWELLDKIRTIATRRTKYLPQGSTYEAVYKTPVSAFDDISKDAQTVLMLILDSPKDFAAMVFERGGKPRNYRSSLREYLRTLGWTHVKVAQVFEELQTAIASE